MVRLRLAGIAAVYALDLNYFLEDYQKERNLRLCEDLTGIVTGVDTSEYGIHWQANQSKLALASGRFTGVGLGQGPQTQSDAIFAKHSDFIFAVVGEELGMIGCCAVLFLLLLVIVRCVTVGLRSKNTLSMLVCFGVAATVAFQPFENIGMCIGIAPVVGIRASFSARRGRRCFPCLPPWGLCRGAIPTKPNVSTLPIKETGAFGGCPWTRRNRI
jgi:cell division protein FtsW (lipid II flippase)